jgi:anaerobic ribonucleoside-triphosphate reductase
MKTVERVVGQGVPFDRVRRITGYLVGTLERFNNAKRSEVRDRVRHAGPERGAQ